MAPHLYDPSNMRGGGGGRSPVRIGVAVGCAVGALLIGAAVAAFVLLRRRRQAEQGKGTAIPLATNPGMRYPVSMYPESASLGSDFPESTYPESHYPESTRPESAYDPTRPYDPPAYRLGL